MTYLAHFSAVGRVLVQLEDDVVLGEVGRVVVDVEHVDPDHGRGGFSRAAVVRGRHEEVVEVFGLAVQRRVGSDVAWNRVDLEGYLVAVDGVSDDGVGNLAVVALVIVNGRDAQHLRALVRVLPQRARVPGLGEPGADIVHTYLK